MKDRFIRFWKAGTRVDPEIKDQALSHSCAGRVVSALTFIVIILCLAVWTTVFLLLKDHLFSEIFSGNLLTDLTCILFFGGLAVAILVGAMAGNFLRRAFWKMLTNRKNE